MGAFDKLPPRSPVTAFSITAWNAMLDMLNWWKTERGGGGRHGGGGFPPRGDVAWIKNSSGADRERFDILGISDVLYDEAEAPDEFKNKRPLVGIVPDAAIHAGKFAILLQPVANGAMGQACVSGLCVVRVTIGNESIPYTRADIQDGVAGALVGSPHGPAQILWRESGTGPQWAVVRLGVAPAPRMVYFRLKESYYPGDGFAANNHVRAAYAFGDANLDVDSSDKLMPIDVRFPIGDYNYRHPWLGLGTDDASFYADASHGIGICDSTGVYRVASLSPQRRTAKVQGGVGKWTANVNGWQDVAVPVKLATPSGSEMGNEFSAYLRVTHGTASALYPGGAGAGLVEIAADSSDGAVGAKVRIVSPATDQAIGSVKMWINAAAPRGWRLCDGNNGTPNLRNRFIVGVGSEYIWGAEGGYIHHGGAENSHTDHPAHGHGFQYGEFPEQYVTPGATPIYGPIAVQDAAAVAHSQTDNRPPYYALNFIMRVADVT